MRVRIPPRSWIASSNGRTFAYVLLPLVPRLEQCKILVQTLKEPVVIVTDTSSLPKWEAAGLTPARNS